MKKIINFGAACVLLLALSESFYLEAKAEVAQHLIGSAWNETLDTKQPTKPWSWADTWPVLKLTLPSGDEQYVLNSVSGQAMAFGPGHMQESALPGEGKDIVLSAHRDTHFAGLEHVKTGDLITVSDSGNIAHQYRVITTEVVDSSTQQLHLNTQSERLRLITCYPFDALTAGGNLRYVVTALPL